MMSRLGRWLEFSLWYFRHPPWDTGVTPPELFAFMQQHPAGRALDLGCGTGTNAITLAQHGWQVIGVDFALPAIVAGQRKVRAAGLADRVDLRVGDVIRLNGIDGPFDLILDIGCFHSLPPMEQAEYRANVARLLAPSGSLLMYVQLRDWAGQRGLAESEIPRFEPAFRLAQRVDGTEGRRRSAWLTFLRSVVL